ncbi:unnamed protein product, partial [Heligmosomoides polygyrus]|uniref:Transposase n=1 Tax=Heligmosomoides polygyrus TaxID=6339 RepID=A0A183F382_HELPZ
MDPPRSRDTKSVISVVQGFTKKSKKLIDGYPGVLLSSREVESVTTLVQRVSAKRTT